MAIMIERPLELERKPDGDPRTTAWVEQFRARDVKADRWAQGTTAVRHTVETQDRVFRMAQQLSAHGLEAPDVSPFDVLASGDRVSADLQEFDGPAAAASYAGHVVLNVLSGRRRSWLDLRGRSLPARDWGPAPGRRPHSLVVVCDRIPDATERRRLQRWWNASGAGFAVFIVLGSRSDEERFRRQGLDPVVFDGRDPAAHAWAIFEIECRLQLCAESMQPAAEPLPVGLAIAAAIE